MYVSGVWGKGEVGGVVRRGCRVLREQCARVHLLMSKCQPHIVIELAGDGLYACCYTTGKGEMLLRRKLKGGLGSENVHESNFCCIIVRQGHDYKLLSLIYTLTSLSRVGGTFRE